MPLTTSSCVTASPPRLGPSSSRLLVPHLPGDSLSASFAGFVLLTAYIGGSRGGVHGKAWRAHVASGCLPGLFARASAPSPHWAFACSQRVFAPEQIQSRLRPPCARLGTSALSTRCPWVFPVPRKNEVRCLGDSDSLSRRWGLGRCVSTHFLLILVHTAQDVKAEKHRLSNLFMGSFTHGQS